jgi:hypothetical protein
VNEMENHAQQFGDPGKVGSMRTLQFKPHFSAQILSSEEVALLGEGGRYALRGKVYAALVPLLDGTRNDDELVAVLRDRFAPELVYYALMQLESKGYAWRAAGDASDAAGCAWWSAHGVSADIGAASLASFPCTSRMRVPTRLRSPTCVRSSCGAGHFGRPLNPAGSH